MKLLSRLMTSYSGFLRNNILCKYSDLKIKDSTTIKFRDKQTFCTKALILQCHYIDELKNTHLVTMIMIYVKLTFIVCKCPLSLDSVDIRLSSNKRPF